jgi:hypothetical protein
MLSSSTILFRPSTLRAPFTQDFLAVFLCAALAARTGKLTPDLLFDFLGDLHAAKDNTCQQVFQALLSLTGKEKEPGFVAPARRFQLATQRKQINTNALSRKELHARQVGYKDALADLVQFSAQGRKEHLEAIERLGEAIRGSKLPPGRRTYEATREQRISELLFYECAKRLIEKDGCTIIDARRQARDMYYKHASDDTVKRIYSRFSKWERAGQLYPSGTDAERREWRFLRSMNELSVHPPIYDRNRD